MMKCVWRGIVYLVASASILCGFGGGRVYVWCVCV